MVDGVLAVGLTLAALSFMGSGVALVLVRRACLTGALLLATGLLVLGGLVADAAGHDGTAALALTAAGMVTAPLALAAYPAPRRGAVDVAAYVVLLALGLSSLVWQHPDVVGVLGLTTGDGAGGAHVVAAWRPRTRRSAGPWSGCRSRSSRPGLVLGIASFATEGGEIAPMLGRARGGRAGAVRRRRAARHRRRAWRGGAGGGARRRGGHVHLGVRRRGGRARDGGRRGAGGGRAGGRGCARGGEVRPAAGDAARGRGRAVVRTPARPARRGQPGRGAGRRRPGRRAARDQGGARPAVRRRARGRRRAGGVRDPRHAHPRLSARGRGRGAGRRPAAGRPLLLAGRRARAPARGAAAGADAAGAGPRRGPAGVARGDDHGARGGASAAAPRPPRRPRPAAVGHRVHLRRRAQPGAHGPRGGRRAAQAAARRHHHRDRGHPPAGLRDAAAGARRARPGARAAPAGDRAAHA